MDSFTVFFRVFVMVMLVVLLFLGTPSRED
ncbi:hypothetical protein LCGC14_2471910 [marine sediment metagenome]|uniref:Uncharacterized protein n=1 Tax=marine sediment metagenome TaxID=412755 RepID=A0A0F9BAW6_9ZZZZ